MLKLSILYYKNSTDFLPSFFFVAESKILFPKLFRSNWKLYGQLQKVHQQNV